MAVQVKSVKAKDKFSKAKSSTIHYVKVLKGNRKGAAEAIGGRLVDHQGLDIGDFHIVLTTVVNGKPAKITVQSGDIVFRTNDNKRWQVGNKESLKKRFPTAKFA